MTFTLNAVLSLLIGIPAIFACVRYRKTDPSFRPFLLLLVAGFVNEVVSLSLVLRGHYNIVNYNLYSLAESLLLLWQFARWEVFRDKRIYLLLQVVLFALWCCESFVFGTLSIVHSYHSIAYSFAVTLLSITVLNRTMFESTLPLFRNPVFLVCLGLAIFNTYTVLLETFWLYGLNGLTRFRVLVLSVKTFVNLFANVVFTLAVLWSPINYRYLLRSLSPAP